MKYCSRIFACFAICLATCAAGYGQEVVDTAPPAHGNGLAALGAQPATYIASDADNSAVRLASCGECGVDWGAAVGACGDAAACGDCGIGSCCGRSRCNATRYFWGEFLYLNPRDADVAFADPINWSSSQLVSPIQIGPVGVLDPDYNPGFRTGFALELDCWSRVGAEFTHFESGTSAASSVAAPNVLHSLVAHPATASATASYLAADARLDIDFDLVDVDYRCIFACGQNYAVNYLVGARYGHLAQEFQSQFINNGVEEVDTEITFDGGGIRFGLEAERHSCRSGLMVYGKAIASFVAGEFSADYQQRAATDAIVVDTSWKAGRVVAMTDLEVGAGWVSRNGGLRLSCGYLINGWFNTVNVDEFIGAVQTNNFVGLGDHMTFDGLVARVEGRF